MLNVGGLGHKQYRGTSLSSTGVPRSVVQGYLAGGLGGERGSYPEVLIGPVPLQEPGVVYYLTDKLQSGITLMIKKLLGRSSRP